VNRRALPSRIQLGGESLYEGPLLWGSKRDLESSADSERDLAVVDVGEGPRIEVDSERTWGFLLGLVKGQPVCGVCFSLETLLMLWHMSKSWRGSKSDQYNRVGFHTPYTNLNITISRILTGQFNFNHSILIREVLRLIYMLYKSPVSEYDWCGTKFSNKRKQLNSK